MVIWHCVLTDENITDPSNGLVRMALVFYVVYDYWLYFLLCINCSGRKKKSSMQIKMKPHNE